MRACARTRRRGTFGETDKRGRSRSKSRSLSRRTSSLDILAVERARGNSASSRSQLVEIDRHQYDDEGGEGPTIVDARRQSSHQLLPEPFSFDLVRSSLQNAGGCSWESLRLLWRPRLSLPFPRQRFHKVSRLGREASESSLMATTMAGRPSVGNCGRLVSTRRSWANKVKVIANGIAKGAGKISFAIPPHCGAVTLTPLPHNISEARDADRLRDPRAE
jgi:hypothetical protein